MWVGEGALVRDLFAQCRERLRGSWHFLLTGEHPGNAAGQPFLTWRPRWFRCSAPKWMDWNRCPMWVVILASNRPDRLIRRSLGQAH